MLTNTNLSLKDNSRTFQKFIKAVKNARVKQQKDRKLLRDNYIVNGIKLY